MSKMLIGSLSWDKLKEAGRNGHSAFYKGKDGNTYFNVIVWLNDEKDKYGNDASVQLNPKKDKKDTDPKIYIGNLKNSEDIQKPASSSEFNEPDNFNLSQPDEYVLPSEPPQDDLPF